MFGVTTPCVEAARAVCEAAGYEVLVFHATGTGGQTMESLIATALVAGVLDVTTTELADELVGGMLSAGPDRLTAAAMRGVPQVIGLGALDMVNFGPPRDGAGEVSRRGGSTSHNPTVTLMRTTPEENDRLGKEIAQKASAARGPTAVYVPLRGVSALDREGAAVLVAGGRRGAVPEPARLDEAAGAAGRTGPARQRPGVRGGDGAGGCSRWCGSHRTTRRKGRREQGRRCAKLG